MSKEYYYVQNFKAVHVCHKIFGKMHFLRRLVPAYPLGRLYMGKMENTQCWLVLHVFFRYFRDITWLYYSEKAMYAQYQRKNCLTPTSTFGECDMTHSSKEQTYGRATLCGITRHSMTFSLQSCHCCNLVVMVTMLTQGRKYGYWAHWYPWQQPAVVTHIDGSKISSFGNSHPKSVQRKQSSDMKSHCLDVVHVGYKYVYRIDAWMSCMKQILPGNILLLHLK